MGTREERPRNDLGTTSERAGTYAAKSVLFACYIYIISACNTQNTPLVLSSNGISEQSSEI